MKNKLILSVLLIFICLFSVVSCGGNNDLDGDQEETPSGEYIYTEGSSLTIVYNAGSVSTENLDKLINAVAIKSPGYKTVNDGAPAAEHEIILGRSDREISVKAYKRLERMERTTDDYVGYCIYSDGTSVAIAYDDELYGVDVAENVAIDAFVNKYLTEKTLKIEKGVADEDCFDGIEKQGEIDEVIINARWEEVEEVLVKLDRSYLDNLAAKPGCKTSLHRKRLFGIRLIPFKV